MTSVSRGLIVVLALLPAGVQERQPDSRITACLAREPAIRAALAPELREISGLALTSGGRLLAHADEFARILELDPRTGAIRAAFRLGQTLLPGDFEAITAVGDRILLATSAGTLYETREGRDGEALPYSITRTGTGRICEMEGMTWDPDSKSLLLLCKTSRTVPAPKALTVLRWSRAGARWLEPDRITIPMPAPFRGSELARDPVSGHLVAISAQGNQVVEFTVEGRVVGIGKLGKHHRQPEALAIAPDGTIWVGDEGVRGPGQLSVYSCGR